jgi:5-methylcytosine-specific restriction endonuclease McrA
MADKRKYRDRAEYLKAAVDKRRKKIREMAVEYKGGKCFLCGYKKCIQALEFHHLDKSQKDFGLSADGITRSWIKTKHELDKCVMLCANCHREVHAGLTQLPAVMLVEKQGELREA